LYDSVAREVIGSYYLEDGEYYFITAEGKKRYVDWEAALDWVREYNSDRYGTDIINMLHLFGPQDLPIFALELMQEEGYDVRTFQKNGDELTNVSYIALMKAEEEANTPTNAEVLKGIGMDIARGINVGLDFVPVVGSIK